MHFVLSCYLQCALWGGEMQQTKPQGWLLSLGKAAISVAQAVPQGLGDGSGADPSQRAPCQRPWANTEGGQRAGDAPRIGTPSPRCVQHRCIWPRARQIVSFFALAPGAKRSLVDLLPSRLDKEIPSTCATRWAATLAWEWSQQQGPCR